MTKETKKSIDNCFAWNEIMGQAESINADDFETDEFITDSISELGKRTNHGEKKCSKCTIAGECALAVAKREAQNSQNLK